MYTFINVKKSPIDKTHLGKITNELGMDSVFNMKSTVFRKMKLNYDDLSIEKKLDILYENQGMIKRPLLEKENKFHAGFDENKIMGFVNL